MLTIYYDGDCGFCLRWATRFTRWLAVPDVNIIPAQTSWETYKTMRIEHSWIVNVDGTEYYRYAAFTRLVKHSPRLFWIYPILTLPGIRHIGDRYYLYVSKRRRFI